MDEVIIKNHGIRSGTAQRVTAYVLAHGDNDTVEVLEGAPDGILDADAFAQSAGHKNSILHITISPDQEITEDELGQVVAEINEEFGFDCEDPNLLVRHVCIRSNGEKLAHYHLLRPAADADGRVYDTYRSKKKDETVSRLMEIKLGHKIIAGKHSDFVHDRFMERGLTKYAEQLSGLVNQKPVAAIGSKQHQRSKRVGVDAAALASGLKEVATLPKGDQARAFSTLLAQHDNCTIEQGRRKSRLLVKKEGEVICNANRILKIPATDVGKFIDQTKEEIESAGSKQTTKNDDNSGKPTSNKLRGHDTGFAGNDNTQSTSNYRGQSNTQEQHGRDCADIRRPQGGLVIGQLAKAARNVIPMADDLKAAAKNYNEASAEPIPDLDDPFLMMKLSRALKKSLGNKLVSKGSELPFPTDLGLLCS
ncbi:MULTISPECIES: hypothetical protein [Halocynthiibacter]|uniref:Relaxase/mobilization nuclease domain-containing protein n=1 Tax=Halocynthiibacter halioticoli TaxID=2986804 RepID=A0AAE3J004_9RHOB|nr:MULTISPECIES: hypothetical protein [Halocynthiibacter]MCV6825144.1 hypothetical protein [Halocynthiibacter halioticoli]MCW4058145.1 hypothetical protein [Halocynthiibacter sp. SDUM655004]